MIINLTVENFVIIEKISLNFNEGFSAFTGETGAGKSLIIDAISIILGNRFSLDYLRKGSDKARIEIAIILPQYLIEQLNDLGFDSEDIYIFTKELDHSGKSISRINGRVTTATIIKNILSQIIDIHSQYDNQYLLSKKYHLNLLDNYLNSNNLIKLQNSYYKYKNLFDHYQELKEKKYNPTELDFLKFQLNEIDEIKLKENEIEDLEKRFKLLSALEKSTNTINDSIHSIDNSNTIGILWQCLKNLESLKISELEPITNSLKEGYFNIEDAHNNLKAFIRTADYSEREINAIQERLFEIKKIQKKYGYTYQSIMDAKDKMLLDIEEISNSEKVLEKLSEEIAIAKEDYLLIANTYSQERKSAAILLEKDILKHLRDLELPHSQFKISFSEKDISNNGIDEVEFLLATNLNQELRSLNKVASGGELSRIMLGLKTIFSHLQGIKTIIFDEIDTGVSGPTAFTIGEKMKELAASIQVFTITHLAQVAANSEYHYFVEKTISNNETITSVNLLDDDNRIKQLAILAFGSVDDHSYLAARDLLSKGQK
ncbi:MAG: DNA repair protein RecN [Erysipelotrichaceae bacterium]